MLRSTPLSAGLAEELVSQRFRLSEQGPGAVDAFLLKLHAWKADAPNRKLGRWAQILHRQRMADDQSSHWSETIGEPQFEQLEQLLAQGANPRLMVDRGDGTPVPVVEVVADASPRCAVALLKAGAEMSQSLLEIMALHALGYVQDRDNGFTDLLSAERETTDVFGGEPPKDHNETWSELRAINPDFPWDEAIEIALQMPGLDWYRALNVEAIEGNLGEITPHVGRYSPVAALGYKSVFGSFRKRLEQAQADRGETVGRPALPPMSPEAIDDLFQITSARGWPMKGEALDMDERSNRLRELLALGANPNLSALDSVDFTITEMVFVNANYQNDQEYAGELLQRGGLLSERAMIKTATQFISFVKSMQDDPMPGLSEEKKEAQIASNRRFLVREENSFIKKMIMAELATGIGLDQLNNGKTAEALEQARPGLIRQVDLARLEAHTAPAQNTRSSRGARL